MFCSCCRALLLKMARVALQIPNEETFQEKISKIIQRESNHNQGLYWKFCSKYFDYYMEQCLKTIWNSFSAGIRNLSSITRIMERESSGFLINTVEKVCDRRSYYKITSSRVLMEIVCLNFVLKKCDRAREWEGSKIGSLWSYKQSYGTEKVIFADLSLKYYWSIWVRVMFG